MRRRKKKTKETSKNRGKSICTLLQPSNQARAVKIYREINKGDG